MPAAPAAPVAYMLPRTGAPCRSAFNVVPRAAPSQPEAVMPAQPAAPVVSLEPSLLLNMSFLEELGQMTERSDDDTRRQLVKCA